MPTRTILSALARHSLTTLGGILVARGYLAADGVPSLVDHCIQFGGDALVLCGFALSIAEKWMRDRNAKLAAKAPLSVLKQA